MNKDEALSKCNQIGILVALVRTLVIPTKYPKVLDDLDRIEELESEIHDYIQTEVPESS